MLESLVLFAVLVLVTEITNKNNTMTGLGAQLFFWARVAYTAIYIAGVQWVRTAVWGVSVIGLILIFFQLVCPRCANAPSGVVKPAEHSSKPAWAPSARAPQRDPQCCGPLDAPLKGGSDRSVVWRGWRHIRNTPNRVCGIGALSVAENASIRTRRVSAGVMMPSSHRRAEA